jgi:hypothetical protein
MISKKSLYLQGTIISFAFLFLTVCSKSVYADYQTNLVFAGYIQDASNDLRVESFAVPCMYDWNSDGKIDLLVGEKSISDRGYVRFYENISIDAYATPSFNGYTDTGVDVIGS